MSLSTRALALSLAIAGLTLAACGEDLPSVDCTTTPVPTYAQVNAFTVSCNTCHASTLSGAARFGAPPGVDYDTYAVAKIHAEDAALEVFAGRMPETGALPDGDADVLYRWALCGTPP